MRSPLQHQWRRSYAMTSRMPAAMCGAMCLELGAFYGVDAKGLFGIHRFAVHSEHVM